MPVVVVNWKKKPKSPNSKKVISTSVSLDPVMHKRLKQVARNRADIEGGRTSVSALLQVVAEAYISDWEKRWPPQSAI
jgi:hypothetical protein